MRFIVTFGSVRHGRVDQKMTTSTDRIGDPDEVPSMSTALASHLFRSEVFEARQEQWLGEVVLTKPIASSALGLGFETLAIVFVSFLFWGQYTRKIRAPGYVVPKESILSIAMEHRELIRVSAFCCSLPIHMIWVC